MLMVAAVIGRRKTFAYVGWVAVFSISAGLLYGAWVDGVALAWLVLGLGTFTAVIAAVLAWLHRRQQQAIQAL